MEEYLKQKYTESPRCCVCSKLGARAFSVMLDPSSPRVSLCNRHRNEQEKIGWRLFTEKYDFVETLLNSLGFEFRNDYLVYLPAKKDWIL